MYYTAQGAVEGLRQGDWKLLVKMSAAPRPSQNANSKSPPESQQKPQEPELLLFDLKNDLGEKNNLAAAQPEVVSRLRARLEDLDAEITQNSRAPWMKP